VAVSAAVKRDRDLLLVLYAEDDNVIHKVAL